MHAAIASLIAVMSILMATGPTLVGLFNSLLPLVLDVGLAAALLRLVWSVTPRDLS